MKLNFRNKFLKKIKKIEYSFFNFKIRLKKNNFYLLTAVCTILFIVVIILSFQFSRDNHQTKTSNLFIIQKNYTIPTENFAEKKDFEIPPLSRLQKKATTNNNNFEIPPLSRLQKKATTNNNNLVLESKNKTEQKAEILKLLEEVQFQKQSKMTIIIDDFGYSTSKVELFLQITQPITFAILPNLPQSSTIAKNLHQKNKSILVHLPMEPNDIEQKIEKITLMVADSREEIKNKFVLSLESSPFSIGINNHMGSKFTRHEKGMEFLMQHLQEHKLFFLDSKTSPGSIAVKLAKKYGVSYFARDVFLDNSTEMLAIAKQLIGALEISFKKGSSIVIGHPYLSTYEVLQILLPEFEKKGVLFTGLENFQTNTSNQTVQLWDE